MGIVWSVIVRSFVWLRSFIAGITLWQWGIIFLCLAVMVYFYLVHGQSTVAAMGRKFFLKTIPLWWKKFVVRLLPKMIGKAFASKYVKKILLLLTLTAIGKKIYDFLEEAKDVNSRRLKYYLIDRPRLWWSQLSLAIKVGLIVGLVVVTVYFLGYKYFSALILFFDIVIVWTLALVHFIVPRFVASKVVELFHQTIGMMWHLLPDRIAQHPKLVEKQQQFVAFYRDRIAQPADKAKDVTAKKVKKITTVKHQKSTQKSVEGD